MAEVTLKTFRRQLHILALLQNNKDKWNNTELAERLVQDEPEYKKDANYLLAPEIIKNCLKTLRKDDKHNISIAKGKKSISISDEISRDYLAELIKYYIPMVVTDITTESLIKRLIEKRGAECMWIIGSIYFASLHKNQISFTYTNNEGETTEKKRIHPYHLVSKNQNIYLMAKDSTKKDIIQYTLEKIKDLRVEKTTFKEDIPDPYSFFKHSISPFQNPRPERMVIRYHEDKKQEIEQILIHLGEIKSEDKINPQEKDNFVIVAEDGDWSKAEFLIGDPEHLFKHLFFYGDKVEILEPEKFRNKMKQMLEDSLKVYK